MKYSVIAITSICNNWTKCWFLLNDVSNKAGEKNELIILIFIKWSKKLLTVKEQVLILEKHFFDKRRNSTKWFIEYWIGRCDFHFGFKYFKWFITYFLWFDLFSTEYLQFLQFYKYFILRIIIWKVVFESNESNFKMSLTLSYNKKFKLIRNRINKKLCGYNVFEASGRYIFLNVTFSSGCSFVV